MYEELFSGHNTDPEKAVNGTRFNVEYDEMVVVRDIELYSLCVHHMPPFMAPSQWQSYRVIQNSPHCRNFRSSLAATGAHDQANSRFYS